MPIIEGSGLGTPLTSPSAPVAGTSEVQTITIGGTPTGGTFILSFQGLATAPITWSNVNATLVAAIDAALEAVPSIGTGNVVTAVGTAVAGIGTITLTFGGALANRAVPTVAVVNNAMTGTAPTIAVAETTPGVDVTGIGAPKGALLIQLDTGALLQNTGTAAAPTWTGR